MNDLFSHELVHFLIALVVGLFCWGKWRNWRLIVVALFVGMLVDVDHWFDYFLHYGFNNISLGLFFNPANYMVSSGKIYVPLHGWEFIPVLWLATLIVGQKIKITGLEWAVTGAYFGHLFWDQTSFAHHDLAYFFIYRLMNNFSIQSFNGF